MEHLVSPEEMDDDELRQITVSDAAQQTNLVNDRAEAAHMNLLDYDSTAFLDASLF